MRSATVACAESRLEHRWVKSMPRDEWVSLGGLRLHYRDWGGSGQPVVLVHGLASTCHFWDLVAPRLSKSFSVVALEQRGHGDSDKPSSGYDFETLADDLHRFIEALRLKRPLVVGHSWGADVAVQYASSHSKVPIGLSLIDGGTMELSAVPGMTLEHARAEMAPPDFTGMTPERFTEMVRSHDFGFEITPEVEQIMRAGFHVRGDGTVSVKFARQNHMAVIEAFWDHRPSATYHQVTCPVLLMPTRGPSRSMPAEWLRSKYDSVALASRLLPASKIVWLEDSVHDVPLQRPALVARVIEEHILDGFFGVG